VREFEEIYLDQDPSKISGLFILEEGGGVHENQCLKRLLQEEFLNDSRLNMYYSLGSSLNHSFVKSELNASIPCFVLYKGNKK
jgi:hypothetical protein